MIRAQAAFPSFEEIRSACEAAKQRAADVPLVTLDARTVLGLLDEVIAQRAEARAPSPTDMPFSPRRFRFRLSTEGYVSVWPTRYNEVCIAAVDIDGFEEAEIEPAFLTPEEARQVARALITSANEAAGLGLREEREACTCGSGLPTFEGRCPKCFSSAGRDPADPSSDE